MISPSSGVLEAGRATEEHAVTRSLRRVQQLPLPVLAALTPAERRVLVYLCAGYSNKEMANEIGRAEATIKHQVSACLRKMGQPSRARLIAALG